MQTIMFHIILCIVRMNTVPVHVYSTQSSLLELAQVRNVSHLASPRDSHVYAIRMSNMTNARMLASLLMEITYIDVVRNVLVAQKSGIYGSTDFPFIHCYFIHIYLRLNGECTIPYTLDYCNCCDYSAIDGLWTSGVSHTFNVCAGSTEAPQACHCFKGLQVINQQCSYTIELAKQ